MITLSEVLNLAPNQDEYTIKSYGNDYQETFLNVDEIPIYLSKCTVVCVKGYNADGYDGLKVIIL